jgi:hypothetical protein
MAPQDDLDTDTLLAILSSLLDPDAKHKASDLLEALALHDGDVNKAAEALQSGASRRVEKRAVPGGKRKRQTGTMEDWLVLPQSSAADDESFTPRKIRVVSSGNQRESGMLSPTKPVVDLMSVLRAPEPTSGTRAVPRVPHMTLSDASLVAQHTPCTLHTSVLPPELACRLFHIMLDKARSWDRNRWYLFDRLVESPHRTSFFARRTNGVDEDDKWQEAARFWYVTVSLCDDQSLDLKSDRYNGRETDAPEVFPDAMEEACSYVEAIVDAELRKRKRYPLEWDGKTPNGVVWRANVAASNMYEGAKETVGFVCGALLTV